MTNLSAKFFFFSSSLAYKEEGLWEWIEAQRRQA